MKHLDLLKQLIKIKSYSGEEKNLRVFISEWFDKRGIKNFVQDENLIVRINGQNKNKAFIFNSHLDTVSSGDLKWKYGPWNPTLIGDKVFGLGASDMKSGIAASMLLAEKIKKSGKPLVDMYFTFVTKEEVDGTGTQNFIKWFSKKGYLKKYVDIGCIFTESTSLTEIQYGHRGNLFIKAQTKGDSGHASRPILLKKHSVIEMFEFSNTLKKHFKDWSKEYSDKIFEPPTLGELTSINAGDSNVPNKFPSICTATFDIRTTPKFHKKVFKKILSLAKKMNVDISHAFSPSPAGFTNPKEKIVKCAQKFIKNSKLTVSNGSADLGFVTEKGIKGIILGPGANNQVHQTNEYCYPKQIPQAVDIYKKIIEEWSR